MIESGVSKSTHPSFVCSIWAAGLNFLLVLFRGFLLTPGTLARISRMVCCGRNTPCKERPPPTREARVACRWPLPAVVAAAEAAVVVAAEVLPSANALRWFADADDEGNNVVANDVPLRCPAPLLQLTLSGYLSSFSFFTSFLFLPGRYRLGRSACRMLRRPETSDTAGVVVVVVVTAASLAMVVSPSSGMAREMVELGLCVVASLDIVASEEEVAVTSLDTVMAATGVAIGCSPLGWACN